jgi:alpha-beta hydrolase superfamily lysophospholipase
MRLKVGVWSPMEGAPSRELLIVPGLAEHVGRYAHVAAAAVARGWRVHCIELRGHGHSHGARGHVDDWSEYVEDLRAVASTLPPHVGFAHSMGGLVALEAIRAAAWAPTRLALTNPLLAPGSRGPRWKIALAGLLERIAPRLPISTELDTSNLSRDATVVADYLADPLVFPTVTPRWFGEMNRARERARGVVLTMPFAMHVGTADRICDPATNLEFARSRGLEPRVWTDLRHELVNEVGREQVIGELLDWLEQG